MAKPFKNLNPLTYAFGYYLYQRRLQTGFKPEDVGLRLGIASSSIRLLEAGYNPVNPVAITSLIQLYPDIELAPICTLQTVMQVTDHYLYNIDHYKEVVVLLSAMDKQLEVLFSSWKETWQTIGEPRDPMLEALLNDNVPDAVGKYLTMNRYFHLEENEAIKEMIFEALNKKPQYIKGVLQFLKHLPPEEAKNGIPVKNLEDIETRPSETNKPDETAAESNTETGTKEETENLTHTTSTDDKEEHPQPAVQDPKTPAGEEEQEEGTENEENPETPPSPEETLNPPPGEENPADEFELPFPAETDEENNPADEESSEEEGKEEPKEKPKRTRKRDK